MEGKRILGIDPGSGRMGHGLIEIVNDQPNLISHGCIETTVNAPQTQKLAYIYDELTRLVNEIRPNLIAIEMIFFANNAKTMVSVSQARGVALLVAAQANIEIAEIAPLSLKKILMGNGKAKKKEVQNYVKEFFELEKVPKTDDAADAIAVALSQVLVN